MMSAEPTKRFTDRVDNYVKYRPGYPDAVIKTLQGECNLSANSIVADVGSGTGIFTGLLLKNGFKVYAVEPNAAMQQAAKQQYNDNENFIATDGTAEATTLAANSIDLIVCAQAFHWFNDGRTRVEFKRILKDSGHVALIWNNRLADADDFSVAYENMLKKDSIDYNKVNHRNIKDIDFKAFFKDGDYKFIKFVNEQIFDETGLMGRAFSSSYIPAEGTLEGEKFRRLLKAVFDKHNKDGKVSFSYQTEIYLGKV
jgi:SAM-dependent methyltransferase